MYMTVLMNVSFISKNVSLFIYCSNDFRYRGCPLYWFQWPSTSTNWYVPLAFIIMRQAFRVSTIIQEFYRHCVHVCALACKYTCIVCTDDNGVHNVSCIVHLMHAKSMCLDFIVNLNFHLEYRLALECF